jgi:hypothetical protein
MSSKFCQGSSEDGTERGLEVSDHSLQLALYASCKDLSCSDLAGGFWDLVDW